jgi:hypothetical protein
MAVPKLALCAMLAAAFCFGTAFGLLLAGAS